jgi:WD40 repeat protein
LAETPTKLVYLGKASVQGSPVVISDVGSNKLAVVTNRYTLYLLDKDNAKIGASATLIKTSKPLHNYTKALSASSRRDVAVVADGSKEVNVLSFATGAFLKKADIKTHSESIEATAFSKDGSRFASGDIEGAVQVFDTKKFQLILTPDKLGDYVSYIVFSENSRFIAISSYGKTISIYDIDRAQKSHHSAVNGLIERMGFFDEDKIFFITREQGAGIFDLTQKRTTSYKTCFTSWPTSIAFTSDKRYVFVGTKTNYLYVIRLSDNEKVVTLKMNNTEGMSSLCIEAGRLFVGYTNGEIEIIDVEQSVKELSVYVRAKEWEKAAELYRKNSLLTLYPEYAKAFDQGWKEALPKAIAAISRSNIDVATAICKPFLDDEKRAAEFKFYIAQSKKVAEFVDLVEKRDFTKAYNLTMASPFLRKTPTYDVLERQWEKAFDAAKKMLEEDAIGNRLPVQYLLKPFAANVVTKPRISGLMNNYTKYIEADNILKSRDFAAYFDLCAKHAFLKDTQTFKKTMMLGDQLADKLLHLEAEEKYRDALSTAKMLTGFGPHMGLAMDKVTYLSDLVGFLDLIDDAIFGEQDAIISVFEIAALQPKFQSLREFQLLVKRFQDIADAAMLKVPAGNPADVIAALMPYINIQYWANKTKDIMKAAYLAEFKKVAIASQTEKKRVDWELPFETYMSIFGKDGELESFATQIKQLDTLKSISQGRIAEHSYGYPSSLFQL